MVFGVYISSEKPWLFVCHIETARAAQIAARLLAERFPGTEFDTRAGPDFEYGDSHPSIRDSALSFEVQRLIDVELVLERERNPERRPKWIAFRNRSGGVTAFPDQSVRAIAAYRRDPEEIEERPLFVSGWPSASDILDVFTTGDTSS